jgi:DNA-binding response OmpR family regulator
MNKKVLVVDDEAVVRMCLKIYLDGWGFEVKEAGDGQVALEHLGKEDFDLLISDILMPKKDGWEVIKEIRSNAKTKDMPVIVLTAKNEDVDMFKGYDLGANYYIPKPFSKAQLQYAIQLMFEENSESLPVSR